MTKKESLEITIPVLNEAETIHRQLKILLEYIDNSTFALDIKIIIADNGSTDGTFEKAESIAKTRGNLKVIKLPIPGVGAALYESWKSSDSKYLGYMDLDLATDLKHLSEVIGYLQEGEKNIVVGNRRSKRSKVLGRSNTRNFTSLVFNMILKIVFRTEIRDAMCGFKFFEKYWLQTQILPNSRSKKWFFCAEILLLAEKKGAKIMQVPINWVDDSNSKVKIVRLSLEYIKEIFTLKKRIVKMQ
jgi:glycosyltransferase involved in cell wall biosynthesis